MESGEIKEVLEMIIKYPNDSDLGKMIRKKFIKRAIKQKNEDGNMR